MNRLFTQKERYVFERICSLRQAGMLQILQRFLRSNYNTVISTPSYIVALGDIPVGLVAHADTVFSQPPKQFFYDTDKNVIWSPDGMGADDRAGIFAIMKIINSGQHPHIIITTDEECGAIGASKLVNKIKTFPAPLKFLIQLDRRGDKDAVFYNCNNEEFEQFITAFDFVSEWGTFSDISILAPAWKIAAVNLSVGYYEEHSQAEHLYVNSLFDTIEKVQQILNTAIDDSIPTFDYVEKLHGFTWQDDGYTLHHTGWYKPITENEEHCQFCGAVDIKENLLPLHWHAATSPDMILYVCNECYAHLINEIEWCSKCGKGYFLNKKDLENMPTERNTWICKHCQEDKHSNDSVE